jgi:hypothetical protein
MFILRLGIDDAIAVIRSSPYAVSCKGPGKYFPLYKQCTTFVSQDKVHLIVAGATSSGLRLLKVLLKIKKK